MNYLFTTNKILINYISNINLVKNAVLHALPILFVFSGASYLYTDDKRN